MYVAFSLDETGDAVRVPEGGAAALVGGQARKFRLPVGQSDMRFNWVGARPAALDPTEARELVVDAWRMVVPQKLSKAYDIAHLSVAIDSVVSVTDLVALIREKHEAPQSTWLLTTGCACQ